jgi:hypothetical protein
MKNKNILLAILIGIGLLGFLYVSRPQTASVNKPIVTQEISSATVSIDFGDDKKTSQEISVDENSTAFSLLQALADSNDIQLETKQYDFGVFVEKIDNKESNADKSWIYFINGESGQVAADTAEVKPKDLVEWKYITPNE